MSDRDIAAIFRRWTWTRAVFHRGYWLVTSLYLVAVAGPVTRIVSIVWVNRRATSDVRATVQSFLAQAEYLGEISFGLAPGILAQATSISVAMLGSCALVAWAGLMAARSRRAACGR